MTYAITGIPVAPGQPLPNRQEITAWYNDAKNKYQVSLFMQAMTTFKAMDVTEPLSFFQIAGIHSEPGVSWDGVDNTDKQFCAHSAITFPMWHRPYMLLYEQVIQSLMTPMIKAWINNGQLSQDAAKPWFKAASEFRLPYWDWARKQPSTGAFGLPQLCILDLVPIMMPDNTMKDYPNPLIKFSNPSGVAMGDKSMGPNQIEDDGEFPWSKCIGTSRYGILSDEPDETWIGGVDDWQTANAVIASPVWYAQGQGHTFSDAVSRMLSPNYFDSYESFASTQLNDPHTSSNYMSIEYVHNIVHNVTGGQFLSADDKGAKGQVLGLGHMSDVPVAAFDPVFWFHHCNIDRLAAIWQTLNPTLWFNPQSNVEETDKTPLKPFQTSAGNFWTANDARDWTQYGYQYDDLVPQPDAINPDGSINQEKYQQDLRNHVDTLYPSTSHFVQKAPMFEVGDDRFQDYIINIIYDRYALNGRAYSILFFLGSPPDDITNFSQDKNFLGQVYTFSAPVERDGQVACENCKRQRDHQVLNKAQIPITVPLTYRINQQRVWHATGRDGLPPLGIPDVTVEAPTPQELKIAFDKGLHVVFVELGGRVLPRTEFPKTEVAVMYGKGQYAVAGEGLATFRGYKSISKHGFDIGAPLSRAGDWQRFDSSEDLNQVGLIRDDPDAE